MSNQVEFRHIKYFNAVAEELHFRKAAERLYISQPGLSRQIKQMEEFIGFQLFERNNKKVVLTTAGSYVYKELGIHMQNIHRVFEHAHLLSKGEKGTLNFGYVGSAMQNIIPDLLVRFRNKYPSIRFNLQVMDNQQQIENLLSRQIDIGFVRLNRVPNDITIHPVLQDSFSLVLPKTHPIGKRNFESLNQLSKESFILFSPSYSSTYYEKVMELFDHTNFTPIVSHNTVHANTISQLVENNFGISIVPTSLEELFSKQVKFISLKHLTPRTVLSAVWHKEIRNPTLEKFKNTVLELNN